MTATLSAAQRVALALLRGYQVLVSPMFTGSCRFVPSCSAYAVEAVTRFGVVRGSVMAMGRLARCRPLAAHGFDPVPQPDECCTGTTRGRLRRRALSHD